MLDVVQLSQPAMDNTKCMPCIHSLAGSQNLFQAISVVSLETLQDKQTDFFPDW